MPEGPEVKTVARTLNEALVNKRLGQLWHSDFSLRKAFNSKALKECEDKLIDEVYAYGKVLFISSEKKPILVAQLGMTGQLKVEKTTDKLLSHTHIRWPLKNTNSELRYVDPRRFGLFDICNEQIKQKIIKRLGPDPFSMNSKDIGPLIDKMRRSRRVIKEVLLDQQVIAGVGNIYASEALFMSGIDPKTRAHELSLEAYQKLIKAVSKVLHKAYDNGGTTFSNYVDGRGQKGKNLASLQVFKREGKPCLLCQNTILRLSQSGRSTFYCPSCQK